MAAVDLRQAQAAQDHLADAVGDNPEVNGIGLARADSGYVLKVNVRTAAARAAIPTEIDGVTVRVQTVGRVRKHRAD
jgi:hypothetical protein